jgi:hypothetical protein
MKRRVEPLPKKLPVVALIRQENAHGGNGNLHDYLT